MAKYRFTTYGSSKYGEPDNSRLYYAANTFAWSYDYGSISVTWSGIIPDPADDPYIPIHWRLVRTFIGAPDSPYSGDVLIDAPISEYRLNYIDEDFVLQSNSEVTYTIWVFNGLRWINCGSYVANSVAQTNTSTLFKGWLPGAWLNTVDGIGDAFNEPEDSTLSRTVEAYAFSYDKLKVQAELLLNATDPAKIPSVLLKSKIEDLGFKYEPSLGDVYHRTLYKAGHFINSLKGTVDGIYSYAIALTHWPTTVEIGHNLMLDYNDSSFEESTGRWEAVHCTIDQQPYTTSFVDIGIALLPPTPSLYNHEWPMRQKGCLVVTQGAGGDFVLRLPALTADHIKYGIPVTPGKKYVAKAFIKSLDSGPTGIGNMFFSIGFWDKSGASIDYGSSAIAGDYVKTTTTWKEFTSWPGSYPTGVTAPDNAAYASINIFPVGSNTPSLVGVGKRFALDMLQFREFSGTELSLSGALPPLEYQDPRLIKVLSEADLENYVLNPTFEYGTHYWQSYNSSLQQDFAAPASAHFDGSTTVTEGVAKLTALSTDTIALVSDWQQIVVDKPHTFSMYISSSSPRTAVARIEFSSPQSIEDQIKVLSDDDGRYYDPTPYYVDSEPITLTSTAQRVIVTALSPGYTPDNGIPLAKVSVYIPDATVNDVVYFDAAMLTETSEVRDFFNGDGAAIPTDPNAVRYYANEDCLWDERNHLNFLSNSSFETTTGWTAAAGTTLTSASAITPLFGTHYGNVSATGGGSISTVVTYPSGPAIGGEDVIISAYVRNVAGTYSIGTNGQPTANFIVDSSNINKWVRINTQRVAEIGEETFTVTISLSNAGSGTKVFYVDGAQAEFGRISTPFINPADSTTSVSANPSNSSVNISYRKSKMINAGYSFYAENYGIKSQRLNATLPLTVPIGSSWVAGQNSSDLNLPDLTNTLLPSASFETNLAGWSGNNANLSRTLSRGTIFDELLTHGAAYCKVKSLSTGNFSAVTDLVKVSSTKGYYTAIAVKPENEDAYGTYTLTLNWYSAGESYLRKKQTTLEINRHDRWAYLNIVSPSSKTINVLKAKVASNVVTLTTGIPHGFDIGEEIIVSLNATEFSSVNGPYTVSAVTPLTISYVKTTPNVAEVDVVGKATFNNTGVSYASLEVTCTPYTGGAGRTFHLDKVLFRE